jgi:hypothetical protein
MRQQGGEVMGKVKKPASVLVYFAVELCYSAVLLCVGLAIGFASGRKHGREEPPPPTASATATPPRNGSIRTWEADGHWWVVGDGWGVHHPGCPCGAKAEVE